MQQAGGDNPCSVDSEDVEESTVPKALREGDHSTDIIFTVEERSLHFSKAVLTLCSPVFHNMLTLEFIQQHSEGIPLPGKKYGAMALFLQQLHPVYSAVAPLTDDMLLDILALAKEYQVEHIMTKCEQYIGSRLQLHKHENMLTTGMLLLYLNACDQHNLTTHRENLVKLVAETTTGDLQADKFFESVPSTALKDVFLVRCQMLEKRTEEMEKQLEMEIGEKDYLLHQSECNLSKLKKTTDRNLTNLNEESESNLSDLKKRTNRNLASLYSDIEFALDSLPPGRTTSRGLMTDALRQIERYKYKL